MGINQSYGKARLNATAKQKAAVNEFCSDFFAGNRVSTQSQYNGRDSIRG